jgi:6-phosphogluconolactonase (cycloisomerase 2 family)
MALAGPPERIAPKTLPPANTLCAYAGIGPTLVEFALDADTAQLSRCDVLRLPSRVQYAWPHASLPILYLGCAERTLSGKGERYSLCAVLREGPGALRLLQDPVPLPGRPIHLSTDIPSRHVLVAYAVGAPGMSAYQLRSDGTIGEEIPRQADFDFGSHAHQARAIPAQDRAILVARGTKGFGTPSYRPGGLMVTRFDRLRLENLYTVAPDAGRAADGFNPRHLDFHPTRPWIFVSLEGQHQLCVFRLNGADIEPDPLFIRGSLERPRDIRPRQDAGTVHVHPNGRYVYVANRNDGYVGGYAGPSWLAPDPIPVFPGGENNIAVFRIDQDSGEPTLIQNADSRGLHPRTFALDPGGRVLMACNVAPTRLREGDGLTEVPANLALFHVGGEGKLVFARRYDLDAGAEKCWWAGIVAFRQGHSPSPGENP